MKRFSKATIVAYIERRVEHLVRQHALDVRDGSAQVHGRGEDAAIAYGELRALLDMKDRIIDGYWPEAPP